MTIVIVAYRARLDKPTRRVASVSLRCAMIRGQRVRLYDAETSHLRSLQRAAALKRIKLIIL